MIGLSPDQFASRAMQAAQSGDFAGALGIMRQAVHAHPKHARLQHYTGNLLLQTGNAESATEHFAKAFALEPGNFDFAIDQAIALTRQEKYGKALHVLSQVEGLAKSYAHFWSTRANAARGVGELAMAARWYDHALSIEPNRPKALHGRAAVALERGEPDMVDHFDRAVAANQGDPQAWLGKAQALDCQGRTGEAREIAEALARQLPQWTEALRLLSQIRLGQGEEDFTAPYSDAAKRLPDNTDIPAEHCRELAALDLAEQATDVAAEARKRFPDNPHFAMLEAMQAGAAGQDDRAEAIWTQLDYDRVDRHVFEARHWVRKGELDRAHEKLDAALEQAPWDIGGWALRDLIWRISGDDRHEWLHGQDGLVQFLPLENAEHVLPGAIEVLDKLHDNACMPLGQSLRGGGTQTRGRLFDRYEPEIEALHKAIAETLEVYRGNLGKADTTHPLLRHRDTPWRLFSSWSIRFKGGSGHHTSHLHPEGILSSACYLVLPPDLGDGGSSKAGWIALGSPAPDLRLDLPPLHEIQPRPGYLALFPSTLYHGTYHFKEGRRMTVAFDVQNRTDDQ